MATLLTVAQVREHVETDLIDSALTRLNNSADAQVIRRAGLLASETDDFVIVNANDYPLGRDRVLTLKRPLGNTGTITSISEQFFDNTPVLLSADDYSLIGDQLERLNDGTNPGYYWGHRVIVIYAPEDDTAIREDAIIALIKLSVAYQGVKAEKAGDYSMSAPDYKAERDAVLNTLVPNFSFS